MGEPARMDPRASLRVIERRESSLLSLSELSLELNLALDPFAIAQLTLFSLMGHFGTAVAALWLRPEDEPNEPVLMRSFGLNEPTARALGAALGARAGAQIAQSLGPRALADPAPGVPADGAIAAGLDLLAPLAAHGRLIGWMALGARLDREPYGPLDLEYLTAAGGMVGAAVENTRLYHRMLESNRRLRETNDQLADLDRLKTEFLQGVNHELRTPLAVIVGYLDVLDQTGQLDETGRRAVTVANEQAAKLEGMLRNLLDFSELQENALRLEIHWHDPGPLLAAFVAARRPGVVHGLRELTTEVAPGLPNVRCDARRLAQALDVMVDNAVKFTPPGARIVVRAARRREDGADWVAIEVEDDGPGIPEERLAELFEPFRQGDGSTTRAAGGLGLGLALVRQIAERTGARVVAKSKVGEGSVFGLLLPAE